MNRTFVRGLIGLLIGLVAAIAIIVGITAASADAAPDEKRAVCHPVEGKGELGNGWNLISPDKASSHIDETTGAGKHTRKDGRTDVYADEAGNCPGAVEPETCVSNPSPENCPKPENTRLHEEGITCAGAWEVNGFRQWYWFDSFKGGGTPGWYPKDTWSRPIFTDLTPAQVKELGCNKPGPADKDTDVVGTATPDVPVTLPNTGLGAGLGGLLALGILLIALGVTLFVRGLDKPDDD